jgi:hypothetical protein
MECPMSPPSLARFDPLLPSEEGLIAAVGSGIFHRCGDGRLPAAGNVACQVRASFLRLVLLGGPDLPALHDKGLLVSGAWVTGTLDLEGCRISRDLRLADCRFESVPMLRSTIIDTLLLDGSTLPGLVANRLDARGSIYLRAVQLQGPVDLQGARLGGDLMLDGSRIAVVDGRAFDGSHISMRGDMTLRNTEVRGAIHISGAQLGGDLVMVGADIEADGPGLVAVGARVAGDVTLRAARIAGETNFIGARVTGDISFEAGKFGIPGGLALTLNRAVVEGALFLGNSAEVLGVLNLSGTQAGIIVDEKECWPAPGDLLLNRFTYKGFLASPVDAKSRLDWLSRQNPARWGEDFWPQPYEHLAAVLSEMGHQEHARKILYEKERLRHRAQQARTKSRMARARNAIKNGLLWVTIGYGLQPLLAFFWIVLLWLAGVGLLAVVESQGQLRPNTPVSLRSPEWVLCGIPDTEHIQLPSVDQLRRGLAAPAQSQLACFLDQPEAASYPRFSKWIYSIETIVPGMASGQRVYWSPDTRFTLGYVGKLLEYVQVVVGFGLGLLAFAGFSGLVKSR